MEEHHLRQKDLVSIFKTESIVSDVLNGHRKLTVSHIQELAKRFSQDLRKDPIRRVG